MSKKKKIKTDKDRIKELALEIDIMDNMLSALVDVLVKKGVITSEEWEKEIKNKLDHIAKTQQSFREVET
jgi:hypothetical protein